MGACLVKFSVHPKANDQIDAIITVPEEKRRVIHGVVKDHRGHIVKNAVVKLFEELTCTPCSLKSITHTFTDECGQFLFGPLCPDKKYVVKIWFDNVHTDVMEITPVCDTSCLPFHHHHDCDSTSVEVERTETTEDASDSAIQVE